MNALVSVDIDQAGHSLGKNIKLHEMRNEKNCGFSYYIDMANFEAFL